MLFLQLTLGLLCALGLVSVAAGVRVVRQYERGVVFRFGRVRPRLRLPGLAADGPAG